MNLGEPAGILCVPRSLPCNLGHDGRVPCQKVGRHWRFLKAAVDQWLGLEMVSQPDEESGLP